MRVLVTGAAGFIGSNLCEALLNRGDEVWGVDDFNDYYSPHIKEKNVASLVAQKSFRLVRSDIRDRTTMQNIFQDFKPDAVAHLAAMAGVRRSVEQPQLYVDVNINGSQVILDCARKVGSVRSFVFASTSSVYGKTETVPFVETDCCSQPLQPYAATKRAIELLAYSYATLYRLSVTTVRFFTVYGPRGRPDMMPMLLATSIAQGKTIPYYGDAMARDWTFISDIVDGVVLALDKPLGYEILNLGRGQPVKLKEFIKTIEEISGGKAILSPTEKPDADVYQTFADCSKANRLLGYSPRVSVREGVERFWGWYLRQ
jgi:UDP-glucuronate 4-epimerase